MSARDTISKIALRQDETLVSPESSSRDADGGTAPIRDPATVLQSTDQGQTDDRSQLILRSVGEGIFGVDLEGRTTFINPLAARMFGRTEEEMLGRPGHPLVHHSYADGTPYPTENCAIYIALKGGVVHQREDEVFWRKDGTSFPVSYICTPMLTDGHPTGAVVVFRDISDRLRLDNWQRSKNEIFHAIAAHQPMETTLQTLADAYSVLHPGCAIAILLAAGNSLETLSLNAASALPAAMMARLQFILIDRSASLCGRAVLSGEEVFSDSRDESETEGVYLETSGYTGSCLALPMIPAGGHMLGVVLFFCRDDAESPTSFEEDKRGPQRSVRDLAQIAIEHNRIHSELIHSAYYDRLTGLPNRLLLEDRLTQATRLADRNGTRVAVCAIDIDRFRRINENFGHPVGDAVLKQIAARFTLAIREVDTLARPGGDEFTLVLPDILNAADAEALCRRLVAAIGEPIVVDSQTVNATTNIGISIYPDHASTVDLLIQNADTAVEFAKAKGRSEVQVYRPDLGEKVRQIAARERALRSALERNELYLMYQPLYDAERRIHGFEALLRWQNPELGLIPPDQFIPLAEDTGLIIPIGEWVLNEACRQAMKWRSHGSEETKIFVNISALQLGQPDFTDSVSRALRNSGLSPSRLELEVTESLIVPSFGSACDQLQPLQTLGVSIAIDDFGTGHSSFSILHKLPINAIKVDRSFVSRIDSDAAGLSTVRAIVNLARQLNMKTVAEGVETEAQFLLLNEMECDYFQGFLLSRPLTADATLLLFADSREVVLHGAIPFRKSA
jgi:diguanylate cyclase (GGDEF)-like protein/PAS domain S-box-containing protein